MNKPFFCWLDVETTGLDPDKDVILEVAVVITDRQLNEIARLERVIDTYVSFSDMSEYVRDMHTKNGLFEDIKKRGIGNFTAEKDLLKLLDDIGVEEKQLYLAGNTIHFDRSFLRAWMPAFLAKLNYRQVDVSTLKILFQERYPHLKQDSKHRAMDDVEASIAELKHYLGALNTTDTEGGRWAGG